MSANRIAKPANFTKIVSLTIMVVLASSGSSHAIPSPELVIGSISSISQLIALVSAMLGGGAAVVGVGAGMKSSGSGKGAFRAAVAMLVIAVFSISVNFYQHSSREKAEQARLTATLVRPARAPGTRILDTNLKETSFSNQKGHPLGITTSKAANLLRQSIDETRDDTLFIDVREKGENQMGTLPGAQHIRFPDIATYKIDFTNKKAILLCHNGNRSSETCEKLAKLGIDCRFIVGGIEKWIVEGRSFTNPAVRGLSDLRSLPTYQNQGNLFDTGQIHELVKEEDVQFVDVRYPGEFANSHLPGAINIPLRAIPTTELQSMINNLPKKPVIAACYDRRGCFISEVLGLELTRAGYDYRGRYTLPWEYFVASAPKPHIAAWLAAGQQGIWQKAINGLSSIIGWVSNHTGFFTAIILLAAFSRLLVLPISLKAEQDQIIANKTSDELKALKQGLKDDPKRLARAIHAFYRNHGLTPVRNLLALAFLPLMALGLSAIQVAASNKPVSLLWFDDIAQPGPYHILPVIFALLACTYLQLAVAKTRRQVIICWTVGLPFFFALALLLSAAGAIYLIVSIGFLLVQRAYVTGQFARLPRLIRHLWTKLNKWQYRDGIIPLSCTELLEGCGNKSYRLSCLMGNVMPVPDGVVLNRHFIQRFLKSSMEDRQSSLAKIWHFTGAHEVAVRSSAAAEDGGEHSFAGVFDSCLNVRRNNLEQAIMTVAESFSSQRISDYGSNDNMLGEGNILVQEMIDADYAGVLFTHDPDSPGLMMIEVVEGTADVLVSGMAIPEMFRFGRFTGTLVDAANPPIDLAPLIAMAMDIESLFGAPQDIEWTFVDGQFQIVQSRDITTIDTGLKTEKSRRREWRRILRLTRDADSDAPLFKQDEMSEVLPRPTPISLDMMQTLWANGGSVDHACRMLGLAYDAGEQAPSRITTLFGRLYTDTRQAARTAVSVNRAGAIRMKKNGCRISEDFYQDFLPRFIRKMNLMESMNFDHLPTRTLLEELQRQWRNFITDTHVEVEMINIAASYHISTAYQLLEQTGLNPAEHLATTPDAGPARALACIGKLTKSEAMELLADEMGHRASFDYELAQPRYLEKPEGLESLYAAAKTMPEVSETAKTAGFQDNIPKSCLDVVQMARLYQTLKEEAKHQSLRHFAVIRQLLMAIDRRFNLSGLCFFLKFEEVASLTGENCQRLRKTAKTRRKVRRRLLEFSPLAATLNLKQLETATSRSSSIEIAGSDEIRGTRVAGTARSQGRAHVIPPKSAENGNPLINFEDGDIIVCTMVHPAWLPYVLRSAGVVCEVGGWLSHIAIVAREHDVPIIVGSHGLATISGGDQLQLDLDGKVEILSRTEHMKSTAAE